MKQVFIFVILCAVGAAEVTEVTPKLTMVATVEGKSFYLDIDTERNREEASSFCNTFGMRLAEITSQGQFEALDKATVEGWNLGDGSWTGGIMTRDLKPYVWESSYTSLNPTYLPFNQFLTKSDLIGVVFIKNGRIGRNGSFLTNSSGRLIWPGTLCETI